MALSAKRYPKDSSREVEVAATMAPFSKKSRRSTSGSITTRVPVFFDAERARKWAKKRCLLTTLSLMFIAFPRSATHSHPPKKQERRWVPEERFSNCRRDFASSYHRFSALSVALPSARKQGIAIGAQDSYYRLDAS